MSAALERLYLPQAGVVKLFDPPFQDRGPDPGYIKGYLPGVRENGGQYTHGAVWLALACLRLGRTEDGLELLRALLPERRRTQIYQAEPYVLAADVYAAPGHLGRGGWSWYTGAAGWYYRTAGGGAAGPEGPGRPLVCGAPPAGGLAGLDRGVGTGPGAAEHPGVPGERALPSGWTAREIPGRRPPPGTDRGPTGWK